MTSNPESVQVAVRIRPLVDSEKRANNQCCIKSSPNLNQVQFVNSDKAFTYNHVFGENSTQKEFYETSVQPMLDNLYKGYNVTILAYGQTGSGKTHSMGTAYDGTGEMGVIPRTVFDIFSFIGKLENCACKITVSFMELYQENVYDLLADRSRDQCIVDIRDDGNKGIRIPSLTEISVDNVNDTLKCLITGSSGRATAATAMNAQSSRSHAIFTINIYMEKDGDANSATTSKFHLVDLAGSERSKKTKSSGERFREGVNINIGLLALGNVISALGEGQKFISYRDSKLTRLLQDSLGGNSVTLMIACVSPADYNIDESLSTLRYADRARKIKNKPIVNQDPRAAEIAKLLLIIQQLRHEKLMEGTEDVNSYEVQKLKDEIIRLQKRIRDLNTALSNALAENTCLCERGLISETANERLQKKILQLKETYDTTFTNLNITIERQSQEFSNQNELKEQVEKLKFMQTMIDELQTEHKNNEDEIQKHQHISVTTPQVNRNSEDHDFDSSEPDFDEKQEKHTAEQLNLNNELKELNRALAIKEQLAYQIISNANHLVDFTCIEENEQKISTLEKEKDELLHQLKTVQTNNAFSKLSEQRRKRVKELETQITELSKKVQEQARMIKLKEKNEARIQMLNHEIQSMKATKVKLIKTMRSEEQRFRDWKQQREKELMRLKDQDRKRQNQIVRMENMHHKQQTVLKRKVEEAAAINKRLKDALTLHKQVQDRRAAKSAKGESAVEHWTEQEFDVMISTVEAERTRDQLLDDRGILMEELNRIQTDEEYMRSEKGDQHVKELMESIELRTAQVDDLQQKILDSEQDTKSKSRPDVIQTMQDGKTAYKKLFDLATNMRKQSFSTENKLDELNMAHDDAKNKISAYESLIKDQQCQQKHKLSELEKEYEEKLSVFLRQLRGVSANTDDETLKERLKIQGEALEKMDDVRKELEYYKNEATTLKEKMSQVNQCEKRSKNNSKPKIAIHGFSEDDLLDTSSELDPQHIDDTKNDPDWKKTPLYRRMVSAYHVNDRPAKRSSDGTTKCSCKTGCTKICGCRKKGKICSDQCNCAVGNCENRHDTNEMETNIVRKIFDGEDTEETETSKKPLGNHNELDISNKAKKPKKSYFGGFNIL